MRTCVVLTLVVRLGRAQRSVASYSASRRGLIPVVGSRPETFRRIALRERAAQHFRCRFAAGNVPSHRTPRTGRAAFPLSARGRQRSVASCSANGPRSISAALHHAPRTGRAAFPLSARGRQRSVASCSAGGRYRLPSAGCADGIGFLRSIRVPRAVIIAEKQPRTDRSAAECFLRRQLSCLTSFSFLSAFPQVSVSRRAE